MTQTISNAPLKNRSPNPLVSLILAATMFLFPLPSLFAAPISTEQVLHQERVDSVKARLKEWMAEEQVKKTLQAQGVEAQWIEQRLDNLSHQELVALESQLEELPAGGSAAGTIVFIFLILIATDLLGATNIFPAIKPINTQ